MKKIKKDPQRITEIKPFINKYNWEEINFSSEKDDWKKFGKTNVTIALNVLCAKNKKVHPAYVLKHYSNREKQVLLLTTANGEGWHYLAVKKLSALLKGIIYEKWFSLSELPSFFCNRKQMYIPLKGMWK